MTVGRGRRPGGAGGTSSRTGGGGGGGVSPGKVTRTSRFVQRIKAPTPGAGELPDAGAHAVAARGVEGTGGALPHAETIQASFGHHDISGVRAHIGGAAADAADALGARAYATGHDVTFAAEPELRQAAHEAAHVVQQREGAVQLDGGVGRSGDRYEQHADAVADLVVGGASAESLLDTMAAGGGGAPAVQHDGYPGDDECLTPDATAGMSSDDLQAAAAGARGTLAAGPDAGALDNQELVRWELAQRGETIATPTPSGATYVMDGILFSADPAHLRWIAEEMFAGRLGGDPHRIRGASAAHARALREAAGYSPVAGVPEPGAVSPEQDAEIQFFEELGPLFDQQVTAVEAELAAFRTEFEAGARALALEILAESEQRIQSELERYGITREQVTRYRMEHDGLARHRVGYIDTQYSFAGGPEAAAEREAMMAAAREIAASERRVRALRERADTVRDQLQIAEACEGHDLADHDYDGSVDGAPTLHDLCLREQPVPGSAPQLRDLSQSVDRALAHLVQEHAELRADKEGQFPVIAAYTSGETVDLAGLDRLASAPSAAEIGEDAFEKLGNIQTVRARLADEPDSIYKLPQLLDLARARFHVAPGSPRAAVIQRRVDDVADEGFWRTIGIAVLSIGLGLLAAIPTGGASMAVTGTVLAAEVAGLALDAYLLYESVRDFEVQGALTDTDFDRARALSQDEPSLFWLAVDIVGTAVGLAGATQTFRAAARVRRAALAARNVDEVAEQLAELRRLQGAGELSADAAVRLERQILGEHPEPEIARLLGGGGAHAARSADDVAAAMGRGISDAVQPEDVGRLADELGLPVTRSPDLGDEVHVLFETVDGRVVRARSVVVGQSATIGDVLAHRETVDLLRRMERTSEELGRSFDELIGTVVDAAGNPNPFPPGSQAFNSWFELRKYPEMIQQRLGRLGADGVSRSERELLREQVSFFETELAHHRDMVARAVTERGDDFIARAARSNEAAFAQGYPRVITAPDGRTFPIGEAGSQFYYAADPRHGFVLRRYVDAVDAPALMLRRAGAGWEVVEGALTRDEAADLLVRGWPEAEQGAFRNAQRLAEAEYGGALHRVVPLAGIHHTGVTVGELLGPDVTREMTEILTQALARRHPAPEARRLARAAVASLQQHPMVVVRGTDQLRAFGYRRHFISATGEAVEGDLHHWIPLYLGGDHRIGNLMDLDPDAHRRIHELLEGVEYADGVTLDPNQIGRLDVDFDHGVGILLTDGSVRLETLADYAYSMPE